MWQNSNALIVTKTKKTQIVAKLKEKNCEKLKIKLGQNSKAQIVKKLKHSNCDKTQKIKF